MRRLVRVGVVATIASTVGVVSAGVSGAATTANPWPHYAVAGFSSATGNGFLLAFADGTVTSTGDGQLFGDASALALNGPIIGAAATPTGLGYWLLGSDGGVFSFGDATFFGSMVGRRLNQPVVGIASTITGFGYWIAASDGGVFSFGDARFYGSRAQLPLNAPVIGIAPSVTGNGYTLVAEDAGTFDYGDPPHYGSAGPASPDRGLRDIIGMARSPENFYWIARSGGSSYGLGDANSGMMWGEYAAPACNPVVAVFSNPKARGWRLVTRGGDTVPFGAAPGGSQPTGSPLTCSGPPAPPKGRAAPVVPVAQAR